jgi:hypothetical protein
MRIRQWSFCVLVVLAALAFTSPSFARPVACRSQASNVLAITDPQYHIIGTKYQLDTPNLETLLTTKITVSGKEASCVVAHLSALTRITDNYVVLQVRIDGIPMEGHLAGLAGVATPVVFTAMDEQDEQYSDPTKVASFNFFKKVKPGNHLVEVMVAAGSNIDPTNPPTVSAQVLTLEFQ